MKNPFFSTSIHLRLQNCGIFGFYFECATCHRLTFVTLELEKDGIELSESALRSYLPSWLQFKPFWVPTERGRVLTLCACCRSGSTAVTVSREDDGTLCSPENSRPDNATAGYGELTANELKK